ncbi:hypothetical protein SAMN05216387_103221 [Nitrosovibrio tenuis]|uniref:Uncharacterized protein n=1 Tax=Nitrosovibrio tenuis TaxID=1233 RepID=A0A1H7KGL3_9PROT|nr:hypothetical protein SAMN05216387_103221 [Nitrosovibrio tenuis]
MVVMVEPRGLLNSFAQLVRLIRPLNSFRFLLGYVFPHDNVF